MAMHVVNFETASWFFIFSLFIVLGYEFLARRIWRYQRGNQNPYFDEEQTTQWPREKVQKDEQRSTKHTYKTKDRVTRTPLKTGGEIRFSGRVSSSCPTSDTRRVNLVTNPVISHERGKDRGVFTTSGTYPWSLSVIVLLSYWCLSSILSNPSRAPPTVFLGFHNHFNVCVLFIIVYPSECVQCWTAGKAVFLFIVSILVFDFPFIRLFGVR